MIEGKTDQQVLELAARACGLRFEWWHEGGKSIYREADGHAVYWNPYASDADCFRLENAVGIDIYQHGGVGVTATYYPPGRGRIPIQVRIEDTQTGGDRNAARRRASTECAARAQIAREMAE
jgi:hypothetical protein